MMVRTPLWLWLMVEVVIALSLVLWLLDLLPLPTELSPDDGTRAAIGGISLSLVLAIATTVYVVLTGRIAAANERAIEEMRLTRVAQSQAHVTVELWPWDRNMRLFDLAIRNYGAGAARQITIEFTPDIPYPQYGADAETGNSMNALGICRHLPFLAPNDQVLIFFGMIDWLEDGRLPPLIKGIARFTDATGRVDEPFEVNRQDLRRLQCMLPGGGPPDAPPIRVGWGRTSRSEARPSSPRSGQIQFP